MTYLSVCSGIEAISVAWEPLGFMPVGFAEIEPFPCKLLKQKYPAVKNYGDITQYEKWNIGQFNINVPTPRAIRQSATGMIKEGDSQ